jgi:hypothetical protein
MSGKTTIASIVAILGTIAWIYFVNYNWLWLGIVNSHSTGWLVGFGILFIIFIPITMIVLILFYVVLWMLAQD